MTLEPGRLVIFNHHNFESNKEMIRVGTFHDVQSLRKTFGKYGVQSKVFNDLTKDQVKAEIEKLSMKQFKNQSCLIIAILSHGNKNEIIYASGQDEKTEYYSIENDIVQQIITNESLFDKPKIIIVNACKGDDEIETDSSEEEIAQDSFGNAEQMNGIRKKILKYPNQVYRYYSTSEGFASYRTEYGSQFIQVFCEQLDEHGVEKSIQDIMTTTCKKVLEISNKTQFTSKSVQGEDIPYIFGKFV